jgi:hypothetical protein
VDDGPPPDLREHLLQDHLRLDGALTRVISALQTAAWERASTLWAELESGLVAHLDGEERFLGPALFAAHPRDARAIVLEHRHIRGRLAEIAAAVLGRRAKIETVRSFQEEVRAHAAHEDAVLYQHATSGLAEADRAALLAALGVGASPAGRNET